MSASELGSIPPTVFLNAQVFDGRQPELQEGLSVVVADGIIQEVSEQASSVSSANVIDGRGCTLMPGLIDAHVHVYLFDPNPAHCAAARPTYLAHHAARFLSRVLDYGVTTIRDVGGADIGLSLAL